ncbi:MAG: hypothetical protein Q8M92_00795 [Candidatus Subteraquimicrobiales bacterium]|nr:hypothetical protein [Candidatus Subteraquimicrobiales bacterium]
MDIKIKNDGKMWICNILYNGEHKHRIESEDREALIIIIRGLFDDKMKQSW